MRSSWSEQRKGQRSQRTRCFTSTTFAGSGFAKKLLLFLIFCAVSFFIMIDSPPFGPRLSSCGFPLLVVYAQLRRCLSKMNER